MINMELILHFRETELAVGEGGVQRTATEIPTGAGDQRKERRTHQSLAAGDDTEPVRLPSGLLEIAAYLTWSLKYRISQDRSGSLPF
jgi:hypothetical protein